MSNKFRFEYHYCCTRVAIILGKAVKKLATSLLTAGRHHNKRAFDCLPQKLVSFDTQSIKF